MREQFHTIELNLYGYTKISTFLLQVNQVTYINRISNLIVVYSLISTLVRAFTRGLTPNEMSIGLSSVVKM